MEIIGGFMVMMSILGLFLAVVWLIMPFVVITIKGKQDRSLELLETIDKRLTAIDEQLARLHSAPVAAAAKTDLSAAGQDSQPPILPLA